MLELASTFTSIKFLHISGFLPGPPNWALGFGKIEEARYLTGLVAVAMAENDIVGVILAQPIPEVFRGLFLLSLFFVFIFYFFFLILSFLFFIFQVQTLCTEELWTPIQTRSSFPRGHTSGSATSLSTITPIYSSIITMFPSLP